MGAGSVVCRRRRSLREKTRLKSQADLPTRRVINAYGLRRKSCLMRREPPLAIDLLHTQSVLGIAISHHIQHRIPVAYSAKHNYDLRRASLDRQSILTVAAGGAGSTTTWFEASGCRRRVSAGTSRFKACNGAFNTCRRHLSRQGSQTHLTREQQQVSTAQSTTTRARQTSGFEHSRSFVTISGPRP